LQRVPGISMVARILLTGLETRTRRNVVVDQI